MAVIWDLVIVVVNHYCPKKVSFAGLHFRLHADIPASSFPHISACFCASLCLCSCLSVRRSAPGTAVTGCRPRSVNLAARLSSARDRQRRGDVARPWLPQLGQSGVSARGRKSACLTAVCSAVAQIALWILICSPQCQRRSADHWRVCMFR